MAEREVIKEFLATLGFKVDAVSLRTFTKSLDLTSLKYAGIGLAAAGAAVAVEETMRRFAKSMENLYYVSQRTNIPIANLKSLGFAAGQAGMTAEQVLGTIENMKMAMRANPALGGMLRTLGIDPASTRLLTDTVKRLNELYPQYIAMQYAEQFGIPNDVYVQTTLNLRDIVKAQDEYEKRLKASGINMQQAGEDGRKFMNILRGMEANLSLLGDTILSKLLPYMPGIAKWFEDWTTSAIRFIGLNLPQWISGLAATFKELKDILESIGRIWHELSTPGQRLTGLKDLAHYLASANTGLTKEQLYRIRAENLAKRGVGGSLGSMAYKAPVTGLPGAAGGDRTASGMANTFTALEAIYGLPAGTMDRVWAAESSRGRDPKSRVPNEKGALGDFQFIPETAARYGVTDRLSIDQTAPAAARLLHDLMQQYGGINAALLAYGGFAHPQDAYGSNLTPKELEYLSKTAPAGGGDTHITVTNNFTISATDPHGVMNEVGGHIKRTWADLLRNGVGAVR
jgi:hypothetical protein